MDKELDAMKSAIVKGWSANIDLSRCRELTPSQRLWLNEMLGTMVKWWIEIDKIQKENEAKSL